MKNFNCNRNFKIWFYSVSHSTLIIRSEKQYFDVDYISKYDESSIVIDIIFSGVEFISIPNYFEGISIIKKGDNFIFDDNKNHFVHAANCRIGKYIGENDDEICDSSIEYYENIDL